MTKEKRHIVIITTWFPPKIGVAVNRLVAFAKYFDKTKFDVSVLTLSAASEVSKEILFDATIFRVKNDSFLRIPNFSAKSNRFVHNLKVVWKLLVLRVVKDEYAGWKKGALKRLIEIHETRKIDVVISSFSPATPHEVAAEFCRTRKNVHWIADMRDEMSQNPKLQASLKLTYEKIENDINAYADAISTVSEPILEFFRQLLPGVKHFVTIRNGFDQDIEEAMSTFNDEFTMMYAGTFYDERKPHTFFKAMEFLHKKNALPAKWKILFLGTPRNFNIPNEFAEHVEVLDKVSQEESFDMMKKADALLLIQPFFGRRGIYTGKIFDYIAARKPIIAILDKEDVAAALIKEYQAGFLADFDDIPEIEVAITSTIDMWKNKMKLQNEVSEVQKLHRKYQVAKLELLIETILNER